METEQPAADRVALAVARSAIGTKSGVALPYRRSWQIYGQTISAHSNDTICLDLIDTAFALDAGPADEPPDAVTIDVRVVDVWLPPPWLAAATLLWSGGRYQMYRLDGDPVIVIDGCASCRLVRRDRRIELLCDTAVAHDEYLLTQPLLSAILQPAIRCWGWLPLHACAVSWEGRAAVLPAVSGSGKSTLALALVRGGLQLVSEDMPIVRRRVDHTFELLAFPERCRILPTTLDLLPDLADLRATARQSGQKLLVDPEQLFPNCFATTSRPVAIVMPKIAHSPRSRLWAVSPTSALSELIAGMAFGFTGDTMAAALPMLTDFVGGCETYALDTGTDFDDLPDLFRRLLANGSVPSEVSVKNGSAAGERTAIGRLPRSSEP